MLTQNKSYTEVDEVFSLYHIVQDYIFYAYNYMDGQMDGQSDRGMDGKG